MLQKFKLEEKLGYEITDEKYNEILNLEYLPLTRIRKDLTYQTFNRLFVLGRAPSAQISTTGQKVTCWWCICSCEEHKILPVRVNNLTSGNSKSCGCLDLEKSKERIIKVGHQAAADITGQRFGKLTALHPTDKRKRGNVVWICECDCGRKIEAIVSDLRRGFVYSCGCLKESHGSFKIKQILNKEKIQYETEKCFDSCKFPDTNASARFDFYVDNKYLIEYDGEQHFKDKSDNFFKDPFFKRQEHDQFKNSWCLKNHIPLYRISYLDINKVSSLQDILLDRYLVKEN